MAFTTPRTWSATETVTAAIMNTHVRDNLTNLDGRTGTKPFLVWLATANQPPAASAATMAFRNGHPVLEFDAATAEIAIFSGVLPVSYSAGGFLTTVYWMAASATSGDVKWNVYIEAHTPDADDLDSDSFGSLNTTTATTASAAGELMQTNVSITSGDGLLAGESFRLQVSREANHAADTMTGDAQLLKVVFRET